jgi:hypothetical protein
MDRIDLQFGHPIASVLPCIYVQRSPARLLINRHTPETASSALQNLQYDFVGSNIGG